MKSALERGPIGKVRYVSASHAPSAAAEEIAAMEQAGHTGSDARPPILDAAAGAYATVDAASGRPRSTFPVKREA